MTHLTPTQQKILERLPATPDQLAQALYGRATESERNLVYVHIALLRRRLSAPAEAPACAQRAGGQTELNGTAHIVSTPLAPSQRSSNAEDQPCPLDGLGAGSERRPEAPPELDEGPVEGSSRRDGLEADGYTCLPGHRQACRIIYELQR